MAMIWLSFNALISLAAAKGGLFSACVRSLKFRYKYFFFFKFSSLYFSESKVVKEALINYIFKVIL